jgi:hypothetical protein
VKAMCPGVSFTPVISGGVLSMLNGSVSSWAQTAYKTKTVTTAMP